VEEVPSNASSVSLSVSTEELEVSPLLEDELLYRIAGSENAAEIYPLDTSSDPLSD
jgi:hypothetical protein